MPSVERALNRQELEYVILPWVAFVARSEVLCQAVTTADRPCTRRAKYHYEGLTFARDVCGIHLQDAFFQEAESGRLDAYKAGRGFFHSVRSAAG